MKNILTAISLFLFIGLEAQSIYPGLQTELFKEKIKIPIKVESFNLKDVRLLPSRFKENMMRDSAWMVSIQTKQLLHSFRTTAGVFSGSEGGYNSIKKLGGWESIDCDLRGHITGHLLSAYSFMYASTDSKIFKLKGDSLVAGLAEVQDAMKTGYLSAFPEGLIDRNIAGKGVWAPWYTLHKIYAGLLDQYLYAENSQALEIAKKMADWAYSKLKPLDEETRQKMIRNEFGGINECFYNLYAITGNEHYQWLANFFYHNEMMDPLKEHKDELAGKHANTFIPKVIAEARNYELSGLTDSRDRALSFWQNVTNNHSFCTGSNSDKEKFFDAAHFSEHLTGYTGETCCTYNMLKLSRHLFCWTASPEVADYYERALYNHILGQQDPQTGMVAYFLPMLSGSYKVYSTKENSFWCCVGTGFESHAKYGEAIYYHNQQGLYVNLFIPSELNWKEKGLKIKQETNFPESNHIQITIQVEKMTETTLFLRYPIWANQVKVKVNGKKIHIAQNPSSYISIHRNWNTGDRIEMTLPMKLHLETTKNNPQKGALLYGPLVLAGEIGKDGMQAPAPYSNPNIHNDYYTYNYNIPADLSTKLKLNKRSLEKNIQRIGNTLEFKTTDGIKIVPLYDIHRQRYIIYWDLLKL